MKIACSGDLHRDGRRRETCERVLYALADDAASRGADLLAVPGDFYDTHPTEEGVLLARRWLAHVSDRMPALIVSGNHDPEHSVTVLDAFRGAHPIWVREDPDAFTLPLAPGPLHVACLPDLRGSFLAARARRRGVKSNHREEALDILYGLGSLLETTRRGDEPALFVGHLTLGCARMDNDQPVRASELTYGLADLKRIAADAYVLGHIHLRQGGDLDGAPWFYTGSPYGTDFGDLSPKSYTLLHWNGARFDVEIVPTPAPKLVLLIGEWCRFGEIGEMALNYGPEHRTEAPVVAADMLGADVRLRYNVPLDDRAAADRAATDHRASILAAGALGCVLDPIPPKVTRSRAPLVDGARTDAEKLDAFWVATNTAPSTERRERVLGILSQVQDDLPPPPPVSQIRVEALRWAGVGRLVPPGALSLPPGVQVVTGPNRAGKSTLLSVLEGALHREGGKGSIDRLARSKEAFLEAEVTLRGGTVSVRQNIGRKTVRMAGPGDALYEGGRAGYDERAAKIIPDADVMEQITILPQRGNGLLDLVDTKLKTALLRLAGSSRFVEYADRARALSTTITAELKAKRETLARMGDPVAAVAAAEADRDALAAAATAAEARRETATRLFRARAVREEAAAALDALRGKEAVLRAQRTALAPAEAPNFTAIRGALERARAGGTAARSRLEALRLAADRAAADRADFSEQARRNDARITTEQARMTRLAARLTARPEAHAARDAVDAARSALALADAALSEAMANVERVEHRGALLSVREVAGSHWTLAEDDLRPALARIYTIADDSLRADLRAERKRLQTISQEQREAAQRLADLEVLAAQVADLDAAHADYGEAERVVVEEEELRNLLAWREGALEQHVRSISEEMDAAVAEGERAAAEELRLTALLTGEAEHERTAGMVASLAAQIDAVATEVTHATRRLSAAEGDVALADLDRVWAKQPLTERTLQHLDADAHHASREAARAEERLLTRREALRAWEDASAELNRLEGKLGDVASFLRSVDRNGLQAYEADAIGTEIADDATDLLRAHGFRWVLSYEGQRGSEDRTVEQARWTISDLDTGASYDARSSGGGSSGGEEVVVATAIFLAAGAAVRRRGGGVQDATLMIDEMTSAVREPLVIPWLDLLRDGAARTGVRTVLLVPPNDQRLIAACDGVITVTPTDAGSVVRSES